MRTTTGGAEQAEQRARRALQRGVLTDLATTVLHLHLDRLERGVPGQQAHRLLQRQGEGAVALRLGLERAMRALLEG